MATIKRKVIIGGAEGKYYNPRIFDFSKALSINGFEEKDRLGFSGIDTIANVINDALNFAYDNKPFADAFYFEYNVLGSILDSNTSNQLTSFMYLQSNEAEPGKDTFIQNTIKYTNSIIEFSKTVDHYTLFYHPDVFIDPELPQVLLSVIGPEDCGGREFDDLDDWINKKDLEELTLIPNDPNARIRRGTVQFRNRTYESILTITGETKLTGITGEDALERFHRLFHHRVAKDGTTVYMTIPVLGAASSNRLDGLKNVQGQGVVFLAIKIKNNVVVDDNCVQKLEYLSNELFIRIGSVVRTLTYNYLFNIGIQLQQKAKAEAVKTAVSAIMSRNMSHNLGSHFISNTKNYFHALVGFDPEHQAVYRGVTYALQYIQERMDFIAAVTSDDVNPYGAVNAKAQIIDELTPDDKGKRHDEVSLNFLMDNLVLSERISKNSNNSLDLNKRFVLSSGEHTLKLLMGFETEDKNTKKKDVIFWDPSLGDTSANATRDSLETINFAIPGGVLGRHALFSIIENVIRNAAKHGQEKIPNDFIIKMLYTMDGHFVIFDNKKDDNINKTVLGLRQRLDGAKMINDEDGRLNQENKGLKEILICSIWLQNESFSKVFLQSQNDGVRGKYDDFVRIIAVDENGQELRKGEEVGYLAYSIKLDSFKKCAHLDCEGIIPSDGRIKYDALKNLKADIICASEDYLVYSKNDGSGEKRLSEVFPRFFVITAESFREKKEADILHSIILKNCEMDCRRTKMVLSSNKRSDFQGFSSCPVSFYDAYIGQDDKTEDDFLFKTHAGKSKWSKFKTLYLTPGFEERYIDSISGGDFTHTIVQPSFVLDEYSRYKIYESVKTRFIIIDERIFEQHRSKMTKKTREGMLEDIHGALYEGLYDDVVDAVFMSNDVNDFRVLGDLNKEVLMADEKGENVSDNSRNQLLDFVKGERFEAFLRKDIEQHYLERKDIHLFCFESDSSKGDHNAFKLKDLSYNEYGHFERKAINSSEVVFISENGSERYFEGESITPITFLSIHLGLIDKVKDHLGLVNDPNFDESTIVELLKQYFGAKFVSIHSGRGGFDVRESLKKYAFQSYSAVESPLHNSKFLLAQQFYNLNYYGAE